MKLIDALARLSALKQPVITVVDAAACLAIPRSNSAKILSRLAAPGHLARLKRGLWAFPDRIELFALPQYLAAPDPAYVSLHSALYHHGMITQIPSVIYAVTIGRARRVRTPFGVVSFHHLPPDLFFGFEQHGRAAINIATPEKALLDLLYLASGRSVGLEALPELEFPPNFSKSRLAAMALRIRSGNRRLRVQARIWKLLATHS